VENLSFQTLPLEVPAPPTLTERLVPIVDKWMNVIRYGALSLLFLLIYMLVLRPIKRQIVTAFQALPKQLTMPKGLRGATPGAPSLKGEETPGLEGSLPTLEESPLEAKQAAMLKKNLLEKVKKEPATASRLVQNWMRQEGKS